MTAPILDVTQPCGACQRNIGEHTIVEWQQCMLDSGFDITAPYEDTAAGGIFLPGLDGEVFPYVGVQPAYIETDAGARSVLQFTFVRATAEGEPQVLPPMNLVVTPDMMRNFREVMSKATTAAITGRPPKNAPRSKGRRRR